MQKVKTHRGMTLVELCVALALTSFVMILAVNFLSLAVKAFNHTNKDLDASQNETFTAFKLSQAVQESSLVFTVPQDSFNDTKNLTAGWEYLGLMDNVKIPANKSKTGNEIEKTAALVHITYKGDATKEPTGYNASDPCWIKNGDGYFYMDILGHDYEDSQGLVHKYSLDFEPVDPSKTMEKSIKYHLKSEICNKDGVKVGVGEDNKELKVDTVLHAKNALQVVYTGTTNNPAKALAFQTKTVPADATMTLVLMLDMSGSMVWTMSGGEPTTKSNGDVIWTDTRLNQLKNALLIGDDTSGGMIPEFVNGEKKYDRVNVILVPFGNFAADYRNYMKHRWNVDNDNVENKWANSDFFDPDAYGGITDLREVQRAAEDMAATSFYVASEEAGNDALVKAIQALDPWGQTNLGDGFRIAYWRMKELADQGQLGQPFVVVLTDGEMSSCTMQKGYDEQIEASRNQTYKKVITGENVALGWDTSIWLLPEKAKERGNTLDETRSGQDDKGCTIYKNKFSYAVGASLAKIQNGQVKEAQRTIYVDDTCRWIDKVKELGDSNGVGTLHSFWVRISNVKSSETEKKLQNRLGVEVCIDVEDAGGLKDFFQAVQDTVDRVMEAYRGPKM